MNRRIDYHLARVQRALSHLARKHVPVYGVEIGVDRARPLIRCGAGPYAWHCTAVGHDDKGCWQDYIGTGRCSSIAVPCAGSPSGTSPAPSRPARSA